MFVFQLPSAAQIEEEEEMVEDSVSGDGGGLGGDGGGGDGGGLGGDGGGLGGGGL